MTKVDSRVNALGFRILLRRIVLEFVVLDLRNVAEVAESGLRIAPGTLPWVTAGRERIYSILHKFEKFRFGRGFLWIPAFAE
jgi:hypothetical protein